MDELRPLNELHPIISASIGQFGRFRLAQLENDLSRVLEYTENKGLSENFVFLHPLNSVEKMTVDYLKNLRTFIITGGVYSEDVLSIDVEKLSDRDLVKLAKAMSLAFYSGFRLMSIDDCKKMETKKNVAWTLIGNRIPKTRKMMQDDLKTALETLASLGIAMKEAAALRVSPCLIYVPIDPPTNTLKISNAANLVLGYYTGIGRTFQRQRASSEASGNEITLVVLGHEQSGKTTFVRSIRQLFLDDADSRIRLIPIAQRYKLAGFRVMPYPEGDNRLPHIVSLICTQSDGSEYILDIIDPVYDNSNLPQAYMDASDAALCLIDARDSEGHLSADEIQRNLKTTMRSHVQCEMLMNVPSIESGQPRLLKPIMFHLMGRESPLEVCAINLQRYVITEKIFSLCERVVGARQLRLTSTASSSPPPVPV